ncbi:MAG: hypothetical protein S4CHLAM6_08060 [Chlamydiae bacterium]|nr:hypothetical protein [Chlamydiota bacterium]
MTEKLKMFQPSINAIPKQKLSPFIRWPLRVIAYPFMMIDLFSHRMTLFFMRPRYKITGSCKQRGSCCNYIHLGWPKKGRLTFFSKLYILWQTEVLGFYFKDFDFVEDNEVTKVMGCRYLKKDGSCGQYRLRPGLCRNWPKQHFFREPVLLKGCGFKSELRKPLKK